jgi:hypothetical protein
MKKLTIKNAKYLNYAGIVLLSVYGIINSFKGNDFHVFLEAAQRLRVGENIYAPIHNHLQYFYSPLFALLLLPFSFLPYWVGCCFWTLFSMFCLADSYKQVVQYFDKTILTTWQLALWPILVFFLSASAILDNNKMVQMTPFFLWSCLKAVEYTNKKYFLRAGALLALAINIKLLPVFFVPYLLYRGYWQTFFFCILFSAIYLFIPVPFIGHQQNSFLLHQWANLINPFNTIHTDMLQNKEDLASVIMSLVGPDPVANSDISAQTYRKGLWVANIVRVFFVLLTVLFLQTLPFKKPPNSLFQIWEIAYITLLIPLLFPRQHRYAFVFLLPAFIYLVYFFMQKRAENRIFYLLFLAAGFFLSPLLGRDIVGESLYNLFREFKVATFSVVTIGFILLLCPPKKLSLSPI